MLLTWSARVSPLHQRTGATRVIDGNGRDQLSSEVTLETCFKGTRPASSLIRVLGYSVYASKDVRDSVGVAYAGPPPGFVLHPNGSRRSAIIPVGQTSLGFYYDASGRRVCTHGLFGTTILGRLSSASPHSPFVANRRGDAFEIGYSQQTLGVYSVTVVSRAFHSTSSSARSLHGNCHTSNFANGNPDATTKHQCEPKIPGQLSVSQ